MASRSEGSSEPRGYHWSDEDTRLFLAALTHFKGGAGNWNRISKEKRKTNRQCKDKFINLVKYRKLARTEKHEYYIIKSDDQHIPPSHSIITNYNEIEHVQELYPLKVANVEKRLPSPVVTVTDSGGSPSAGPLVIIEPKLEHIAITTQPVTISSDEAPSSEDELPQPSDTSSESTDSPLLEPAVPKKRSPHTQPAARRKLPKKLLT